MTEDSPDQHSGPVADPRAAPLPFLIKVAAALLILLGLDGTAEIVLVIAGKAADINIGNLILCVVGFGLLRRNRAAWGCTALLFGLAMIAAVLGLISLIGLAIPSCRPQIVTPTDSLGSSLLLIIGIGAVTAIFLYTLTRKDVVAVFNDSPDKSRVREATSWGWVIAIVGGFAVAERVWVEKTHEDLIEGTFAIGTTFRIFDATTNEPINGIIIRRSGDSMGESTDPHIRTTGLSGSEMRYSGFAYFPIDIHVGAEGYEEVDVTIDESTPPDLRFSLRKKEEEDPPE